LAPSVQETEVLSWAPEQRDFRICDTPESERSIQTAEFLRHNSHVLGLFAKSVKRKFKARRKLSASLPTQLACDPLRDNVTPAVHFDFAEHGERNRRAEFIGKSSHADSVKITEYARRNENSYWHGTAGERRGGAILHSNWEFDTFVRVPLRLVDVNCAIHD
jgi:hypothetical protein